MVSDPDLMTNMGSTKKIDWEDKVGGERTTRASTASSLKLRRANARCPLTHSLTPPNGAFELLSNTDSSASERPYKSQAHSRRCQQKKGSAPPSMHYLSRCHLVYALKIY